MREAREKNTTRSRRLRRDATKAENALWYRLRARSLNGHKFVRQKPIGPYTVDLICREHRLVIEIDGGQHADSADDVLRDGWLIKHNYRVLRFLEQRRDAKHSWCFGNHCGRVAVSDAPSPGSKRRCLTASSFRSDLSPRAGRGARRARLK